MIFNIAIGSILIIQMGLRWEMATDWNSYFSVFNSIDSFESSLPLRTGMELGYGIFMFFTKSIIDNYSIFLLLHAIIYYCLVIKGSELLSPFPYLSLLLFYSFTMGVMGSNRQLIALAIILFSFKYVLNKSFYKFLACVLIAFLFHSTAIICLLFYFCDRKFDTKLIILVLAITFVIGKSSLPFKMFGYLGGGIDAEKVEFYMEKAKEDLSEYSLTISGLAKRLIFTFIFIYNRKKISALWSSYNVVLNSYLIGIAFYFLFSSSLVIIVSRGSLYFNVMEPILLASQLLIFQRNFRVVMLPIILLMGILYFYQSTAQYRDLFIPYKGIFINKDYNRDVY